MTYEDDPIYPLRSLVSDLGVIVGIVEPNFYVAMHSNTKSIRMQWDIDFPDWKDKAVYYVKYTEPKKIVSRHEFEEQNPQIKKEFLEWEYDNVPTQSLMCIPEDGLNAATEEEHEEMMEHMRKMREEENPDSQMEEK